MKIETFKLDNQGLDKHTVWYVKFINGDKSYLMNIGEKSYNTINSLNQPTDEKQKGGPNK